MDDLVLVIGLSICVIVSLIGTVCVRNAIKKWFKEDIFQLFD